MPDLSLHAVQWCSRHGHPVLALRTEDGRAFIVAMTTEDAAAFADNPDAASAGRAPCRLHRLAEAMIAALGARLTAVHLHVGLDDVLRASLQIMGPHGEVMLPAHFADGVALAHRNRIPLQISPADLMRVPLTRLQETNVEAALPATAPARQEPPTQPPSVYHAFIDSLELDDFGPAPDRH